MGGDVGAARSSPPANVLERRLPRALDRPLARLAHPLVAALRASAARAVFRALRAAVLGWGPGRPERDPLERGPRGGDRRAARRRRGLSRGAARDRGRRRAHAALRAPTGGRSRSSTTRSAPKAWQRKALVRLRDDAYVRLLPRLLFGDDVAVRLEPKSVPLWLRPGVRARAVIRGADLAHGGVRGAVHALPGPVRARALALRNAVFRRL